MSAELPILEQPNPGVSAYRYAVTVEERVMAAHQLKLPYASKCNKLHGHEYRVRVALAATQLDANGMVIDFVNIKQAIQQYDHQNLNDFVQPSTAEKFGEVLLDQLQSLVRKLNPYAVVLEVAVGETPSTMVSVQYARKE